MFLVFFTITRYLSCFTLNYAFLWSIKRHTHFNKLVSQLKSRGLESEILSGRVGEDEAEVDVDDVSVGIEENIPVMPGS